MDSASRNLAFLRLQRLWEEERQRLTAPFYGPKGFLRTEVGNPTFGMQGAVVNDDQLVLQEMANLLLLCSMMVVDGWYLLWLTTG